MEQQKETYRKDLMEAHKKFEITLEQMQKRGSIDKNKQESNQSTLVKMVEQKFRNQIREMAEGHNAVTNESQSKIKRLETDIKMLSEKSVLESRGKMGEYSQMEKKIGDLQENEKKMITELEEAKNERDRRIYDYQKQQEKDKEQYKMKLSEYEQKAKDAENRRGSMMFEHEKERAKWHLEIDGLSN